MRRLLPVVLLAALALVSCGGGDDKESVEDILDQAFRQEIKSADLTAEAELDLEGPSASRPLRIEANGPFSSNEGKLPSVDLDLQIGADGPGQTIQTGFLSTGDRAFVKFQDVFYEQPPEQVRRANRELGRKGGRGRGSLRALGLDPRSWLGQAKEEGDEEIGGVETRHVSGTLDVEAVMRNLNEFVRRSGSALGGATGQPVPRPLSAQDISRVGQVVKDPSFDIYVGKDDDIIRRVSGRIEFEVPPDSREALGGLESGTLTFSVEMSDINEPKEIEAPANARPLSALTDSLGAGALGLGEGVPGAPQPDQPSAPEAGGEESPETEAFRDYSDCLDDARPEDTEALQECADLLQQP